MKKLLILSLTLISPFAMASELNVPNQFEDGQVTSAEQMNANFEAIQAAVNDNHARIESMQQPTKAVFQGFSTDSMNGGQGLIAMQQACHNFVPGSHICNTTEFSESPFNASAVETMLGNAWLLSDVVGGDVGGHILEKRGTMFDRAYSDATFSCQGWMSSVNSSNDKGIMVTSTGAIGTDICSNALKVACCK